MCVCKTKRREGGKTIHVSMYICIFLFLYSYECSIWLQFSSWQKNPFLLVTLFALNFIPMAVDIAEENRCLSIIPGGDSLKELNVICLKNPLKISGSLFLHSLQKKSYL